MGHDPVVLKLVVIARKTPMQYSVFELVGSEDSHPFLVIGVSLN